MKHTIKVTFLLAIFFLATQFVGLIIINQYIDHKKTAELHEVVAKPLPLGLERPEVENKDYSWVLISATILVGTLFMLFLIKIKTPFLLKLMYLFSILFTLSVAFYAFIENIYIVVPLAFLITVWRLYRPNLIVQNFSEIFIYGGLAAFFVSFFNIFSSIILLLVISVYDYVSVYKTKHMVEMAKFQLDSKIFAGFHIPYSKDKILMNEPMMKKTETKSSSFESSAASSSKSQGASVAVLGGGDIGFTLLFSGTVMQKLVLFEPLIKGFMITLIIPVCTTVALFALLVKGQKNKFYPAMPIVTIGCLIGFVLVMLLSPQFSGEMIAGAIKAYNSLIAGAVNAYNSFLGWF